MSEFFRVILIIAVVAFVIGRQLMGEPLRGKRVVVLPIVLTVIGFSDLSSSKHHIRPADVACLVVGGIAVALIGVAQAAAQHVEMRDGYLWGQMPVKALWLWVLLIVTRVITTLVADGVDAKVAASSSTILLMLGINRLAQAAVVLPRAITAGVDFAPEKDGKSLLTGLTGGGTRPSTNASQGQRPTAPPTYGTAYPPPTERQPYGLPNQSQNGPSFPQPYPPREVQQWAPPPADQSSYGPVVDSEAAGNGRQAGSGSSIDWNSVASQVAGFLQRRRDR